MAAKALSGLLNQEVYKENNIKTEIIGESSGWGYARHSMHRTSRRVHKRMNGPKRKANYQAKL